MTTAGEMRKLALAMPEVEERSHFEQPDFRVAGKIFAGLSRDAKQGTLKLTPEIQASVVGARSGATAFEPAAGAWGRSGWTKVDLARVDRSTLAELVVEAWRIVAPKALVAAYDAKHSGKKTAAPARKKTKKRAAAVSSGRRSSRASTARGSSSRPR